MKRVLVTGSRDWTNIHKIQEGFIEIIGRFGRGPHILVSGACPTGADKMAEEFAESLGWTIERHPDDSDGSGMIDLGADICIAFIKNESAGATMIYNLALEKDIPTIAFAE